MLAVKETHQRGLEKTTPTLNNENKQSLFVYTISRNSQCIDTQRYTLNIVFNVVGGAKTQLCTCDCLCNSCSQRQQIAPHGQRHGAVFIQIDIYGWQLFVWDCQPQNLRTIQIELDNPYYKQGYYISQVRPRSNICDSKHARLMVFAIID